MRVLVVEDEIYMAKMIVLGLSKEGFAADSALDGGTALEMLAVNDYDLVVLDRDLPVVHGDDVARAINRDSPGIRVLMLTAASRLGDKVTGLELGADDYLAKPFDFPELVARLRALYRRVQPAQTPQLGCGDLALDTNRRIATRAGKDLQLTAKELAVLELLLKADGAVLSAEYLLEKAWDENADPFTNAVRITVSTLRRKIGQPPLIHTAVKAGYYLREST